MTEPVFIVGIDLGTTNSVVSYTDADIKADKEPYIRIFEIPQLVGPGALEKKGILPSFILVQGKHDVPGESLVLPWDEANRIAVGEFARERGAEIPSRLVSSAKSWLCNTMVDRNKPILPWALHGDETGMDDNASKFSPVEASAAILRHIRDAWNYSIAAGDERLKIENQDILLTVPASFDAVARELTVKAADMAGLSNITLLEEPQAAFYAWIESAGNRWREMVEKDDLVLVCDVGGGTCDFSLIRVSEKEGDLILERVAVGDHLLVGGENMDLALAYFISGKMAKKGCKLDAWQMRGLRHSCRKAKESLFANPDQDNYPLTILGRGSSLIGGAVKTELLRDEFRQVILDGFFPVCESDAMPVEKQKAGIREQGLSYEADPAITRHIAKFLGQIPTAVLFNGGVMKAAPLRNRIMDVISSWEKPGKSLSIRSIDTNDFDFAVARGAVYYGITRHGKGIRIRSGLNKSYYIGVAASVPAVPGMPAPIKALCVAPFGMEEGTRASIKEQEFVLVVGEEVKFDFLGSSSRRDDTFGTVIDDWEEDIEEITTIETVLDGNYGDVISVTIEIKVTEIGTLEIWCVSKKGSRRWKLEFNVREQKSLGSL